MVCHKEVPIVLLVTGLEGEDSTNKWWRKNKGAFEKQMMIFFGQACFTATKGKLKGEKCMFEEYHESIAKVRNLIAKDALDSDGRWKQFYCLFHSRPCVIT